MIASHRSIRPQINDFYQGGVLYTPFPIRLKIRNQKRGQKQENGSQPWRVEAEPL